MSENQAENQSKPADDLQKLSQVPPSGFTDNNARIENDDLFRESRLKRFNSDTSDRQWLAVWSAVVVTLWLAAVIAILIKNHNCVHLSDAVLSTLLATTTLNVLGIIFIVLRGHFQSKD